MKKLTVKEVKYLNHAMKKAMALDPVIANFWKKDK